MDGDALRKNNIIREKKREPRTQSADASKLFGRDVKPRTILGIPEEDRYNIIYKNAYDYYDNAAKLLRKNSPDDFREDGKPYFSRSVIYDNIKPNIDDYLDESGLSNVYDNLSGSEINRGLNDIIDEFADYLIKNGFADDGK